MAKMPPIGETIVPSVSVIPASVERPTTMVSLFRRAGLFASLIPLEKSIGMERCVTLPLDSAGQI